MPIGTDLTGVYTFKLYHKSFLKLYFILITKKLIICTKTSLITYVCNMMVYTFDISHLDYLIQQNNKDLQHWVSKK